MRAPLGVLTALIMVVGLVAGCAEDSPQGGGGAETSPAAPSPRSTVPPGRPDEPSEPPSGQVPPISVLGLAAAEHTGDRLRLGAVRERTREYTSYDVTYRSASTAGGRTEAYRISGVLNVPRGKGPFPAVVLAHGYVDPAVYVRGQGMTRERGYLASRGFVALHVDYRSHAESDDDPDHQLDMRLGYSADVINAVNALRASTEVPVDEERVFLFGRSMGGGVTLKSLIAEPGLVRGAAAWASVSSLEAENYDQFIGPDLDDDRRTDLIRRHGSPRQSPEFWRANSSRPYVDRITEPVLLVHGRFDDTCPPRWATATHRALTRAGVDARLQWYADGHAFGPRFDAAMDATIRFFRNL